MKKLHKITAQLRDPESGCPWDKEQSFESIADCTIEEAYEVVEAIESQDYESLKDELGDLLFQVSFHSLMAEEKGLFTLDDVIDSITDKLIRRHPHVFSDKKIHSSDTQTDEWERIKVIEQRKKSNDASLMDGIGNNQPALNKSFKIGKKARAVGFDWPEINGVYKKIFEEIDELKAAVESSSEDEIENELGDLFFTLVSLARHLKVNPESALRSANKKFIDRFKTMEHLAKQQNKKLDEMSLEELESLWQLAKENDQDGQ
tara:strand:- start:1479 stop:2261 length:783 start_codon:yes stop_codon:yes gene_type:complete